MLALVRSFLASRAQDNRITLEELAAFTERTGIEVRLTSKQPQIAAPIAAPVKK